MRTILLLLISVAVVLPATESNPRVTRVIDSFSEASQSAQEAYEEGLRQLEEARAQALNRARERAVRDLKRLVNRRGDFAEQAAIYTQVLRLDREDADAVAFFTAIGTLDNVLEGLEPLVETDLLGNVVGAGASNSKLAAISVAPSPTYQVVESLDIGGRVFTNRPTSGGGSDHAWSVVPEELNGLPYIATAHRSGGGTVDIIVEQAGIVLVAITTEGRVTLDDAWTKKTDKLVHLHNNSTAVEWSVYYRAVQPGQRISVPHGTHWSDGTTIMAETISER